MDKYISKITWKLKGYTRAPTVVFSNLGAVINAAEQCGIATLKHYFKPYRFWPYPLLDTSGFDLEDNQHHEDSSVICEKILRRNPEFCSHLIWQSTKDRRYGNSEFRGITLFAFADRNNAKFMFYMREKEGDDNGEMIIGENMKNVFLEDLERFAEAGVYVVRFTE